MEVLSFLIANYLIFLSVLGLGSLSFKITKEPDIFFVFLTGYSLLGIFSVFINFFYPINFTISLFSLGLMSIPNETILVGILASLVGDM